MFPIFTVKKIEFEQATVVGSIDRTIQGKEIWIKDKCAGTLLKGKNIAFGRWFFEDAQWRFKFDDGEKDKISIKPDDELYVIDGYWGERIEIVFDDKITWSKRVFKSKDKWDHEHCAICWEAISETENAGAYFGGANYSVCILCYKKHVLIKDISFVPSV